MVKKEELFVLIKSLSQSERRYFKIFCGQVSTNASDAKYLRLFEAIDKQEVYDDLKIRETFKNEKFIKQLHVMKNYLRNLILKSLRSFHAKISKDAEVKDALRNIEILFHKELYTHCSGELKRALKIAKKYELHTALIELYRWERRLVQSTRPFDYLVFKEVLDSQDEAVDKIQNTNDYWRLAVETSASPQALSTDYELLSSPEKAQSLQARVLYHNTLFRAHILRNETDVGVKVLYDLIDYLDEFPDRMKENPGLYASSINNLISYLVFMKQYQDALIWVKRAKEAYKKWKLVSENRTLLKQVLRTYNVELEIFRDTEWFDQAKDTIADIERFLKDFRYKIPREYLLSFWFQLANINFAKEDYSAALKWINEILNCKFKGVREDLQRHIRFLNLMTHFEQKNFFVMRYFVDNTRRYLKKTGRIDAYEKELLSFFSKTSRLPYAQFKEEFVKLNLHLFPENQESLVSKSTLDYINLKRWIEANQ